MVASSSPTKKARFCPNRNLGDKEDDGQSLRNLKMVSKHPGPERRKKEIFKDDQECNARPKIRQKTPRESAPT